MKLRRKGDLLEPSNVSCTTSSSLASSAWLPSNRVHGPNSDMSGANLTKDIEVRVLTCWSQVLVGWRSLRVHFTVVARTNCLAFPCFFPGSVWRFRRSGFGALCARMCRIGTLGTYLVHSNDDVYMHTSYPPHFTFCDMHPIASPQHVSMLLSLLCRASQVGGGDRSPIPQCRARAYTARTRSFVDLFLCWYGPQYIYSRTAGARIKFVVFSGVHAAFKKTYRLPLSSRIQRCVSCSASLVTRCVAGAH